MATRRALIRLLALSISTNVASSPLQAGAPARKAIYRGGTFPHVEADSVGALSVSTTNRLVFESGSLDLRVPYSAIRSLEYGQKAARRLGLAIVASPLFLLSKRRKHYLTIHFVDECGESQAAVFELGKKIVRTVLASLEARTGLRVEFEDREAGKAVGR